MNIKLKELIKAADFLRYYNRDLENDSNVCIELVEENLDNLQAILSFKVESVDYSGKRVSRTIELYPGQENREPRVVEVSSKKLMDT